MPLALDLMVWTDFIDSIRIVVVGQMRLRSYVRSDFAAMDVSYELDKLLNRRHGLQLSNVVVIECVDQAQGGGPPVTPWVQSF